MSDQNSADPFDFDAILPAGSALPADQAPAPSDCDDDGLLRIQRAVVAAEEVAYHWHIESDRIEWSENAAEVLGCDSANLRSGRAFATYLDPDNFTSRYDTVMRTSLIDDGAGIPFKIEYLFRPEGRTGRSSVWVEDHGKWYGGADGRPVEVYGTMRRIDDRHRRDQHLRFLGNCDPLTGMMNRGRMAEALGEVMTVSARDGTSCALVIAAINNLAVVNEAYGFDVADEVIVKMGKRLRQVVRTGDAIARYSGAKFGIILNHCGDDELPIAAERFLGVARESVIETERGPVWALLSIGAIVLPKHANDANTAMALAEEALSEARRLPSDGCVIYHSSEQRAADRKINAFSATEIVRCLRENRFCLAYQPIVDAATGEPVFHEALLRMRDSAGEIIAAVRLIPIAEKLGLVRLIDRAVVQMAVATLNTHPAARLSINLSGTTATDPRWYPQILDIIRSNQSVTDRLIIEITETVALDDLQETLRFVEHLRELGCSVAIDDFGAGFTSFRQLRKLPVDILKLDGTFCRDLAGNADNRYFVRALIDLARTFNLRTVAEWVETEQDAALLREWKVDFMQGLLYGDATLDPPWPAAAADAAAPPPLVLPSEVGWLDGIGELPSAAWAPLPETEEPGLAPAASAEAEEPAPEVVIDEPVAAWAFPAVAEAEAEAEPVAMPVMALADAAAEPESPPQAEDTIADFESDLSRELDSLRRAIAALDAAFRRNEPQVQVEPSFADLVSDSARQIAG